MSCVCEYSPTREVTDKQAFEELVNEGFLLIEDKQVPQGIAKLQRAAEIAEENAPLNLFIGEHFFRRGKDKTGARISDEGARCVAGRSAHFVVTWIGVC